MENKGIVYKITNKINGKVYVGLTTKTDDILFLKKRILPKRQLIIYQDIVKFGEKNFRFEILYKGKIEKAFIKRRFYIDTFIKNSIELYNITKLNDETRKNMSIAGKGRVFTKEHKENMVKAHLRNRLEGKKRKISLESKKMISKRLSKPVIQYHKLGMYIREWPSLKEAAKFYKIHQSTITKCCKGILKTAKNFVWKFKHEEN